jgi:hypothetical protein
MLIALESTSRDHICARRVRQSYVEKIATAVETSIIENNG